jgi:hypothetical protein
VEPRYTRDVDLAVVDTLVEQTKTKRLATARLRHGQDPEVFVDLLFASSGIEREVVEKAERITYPGGGIQLPVASVGFLIALKVLSESDQRLQDRIDLKLLSGVATSEDWSNAEAAVRLIRSRGFHRGRALRRRLRQWREQS